MWHDSRTSFLARNLATSYLGREPKARVATLMVMTTRKLEINTIASNHDVEHKI